VSLRPIPFLAAALAGSLSAATITVSQDGRGAFSTIQAAVDKAGPHDEVLILDAATYNEQVTLRSPRHHLTLRSANPSSSLKPVIRWSDNINVGPKTCQEALDTGKITFDKNGALRLFGVRDVRIDGIAIDGGGPAPFSYPSIWGNGKDCNGQRFPLFFGNAGLLLFQSSQVVVIRCEITNAYFGAYIKDRDMEGPFAPRGSLDPTSPFARMASGNHLFEGNAIHNNTWGVFMETAWGLGSTFRDNLIYENHHATPAAAAAVKAMSSEGAQQPGGSFYFKDVQFSSMTLQNNTFWRNYLGLAGGFRPGAQHLIVNNIFAEPHIAWNYEPNFSNSFLVLDPYFPKRMKCNAYASQSDTLSLKLFIARASDTDSVNAGVTTVEKEFYYSSLPYIRIMNNMPALQADTGSVLVDLPLSTGVKQVRVPLPLAVYTGAVLQDTGSGPRDFSAADQNRWVQTKFLSLQPADTGFLQPEPKFREFLQSGWGPLRYPGAGFPSRLGALPASARPQALLRIVPLAPVLVEGGQMVLRFTVQALQGGSTAGASAPAISYLRMVRKLPSNPNAYGGSTSLVVPEAEAISFSSASIHYGYNEVKLPPSGLSADSNAAVFVEMAVQGMGTLSNVAQFPILPLASLFTVEALDETQDIPATGFAVGKTFRFRVAYAKTPTAVNPIRLSLASGAVLKFIDPAQVDSDGSIATPLPFTAQVQFTETPNDGVELICASAYMDSLRVITGYGQSPALVFEGTLSALGHGKGRARLKPADLLKRRNLMGRRIRPL
jgi:hypothetical protein